MRCWAPLPFTSQYGWFLTCSLFHIFTLSENVAPPPSYYYNRAEYKL